MSRRTLISGGTGYVGYQLARRLLATTDDHVEVWLRAPSEAGFRERSERLRRWLADTGSDVEARLSFAPGDLRDDRPFARVRPQQVRRIVHCAANTRFDLPREDADQLNVRGTVKLLEFARSCPRLESVVLVSTVYASGLHEGGIPEVPLPDSRGFANHYERSKWAAERGAIDDFASLPWRIARTATVLADDTDGRVSQLNVIHKTLRLMYVGLLPLHPGLATLPIYLVTGRFVADALAAVLDRSRPHEVYHVCHSREESCSLGDWLASAYRAFSEDESFARRRFMRPMLTDQRTFQALADSVTTFSRDLATKAVVELVQPFAAQMFIEKSVENARMRGLLAAYAPLRPLEMVGRVACDLIETDWGRRPRPGEAIDPPRWFS